MSLISISNPSTYKVPAYQEAANVKAAGLSVDDHYAKHMGPVRHRIRAFLIPIVRAETYYLAGLQQRCRNDFLDLYFVHTANLGTHTAFLVFLPMIFWFGSYSLANALVDILGAGIFFSGVLKDYCCLPRPLSPPLRRITMSGSAALEYGFPSSHATNALSIAVYIFMYLKTFDGPPSTKLLYQALTVFYVFTIVFGRLYTGMHGFCDVVSGAIIGSVISWLRWTYTPTIETYFSTAGTISFFILFAIVLVAVRLHPEPADPCPCFDDGVAFAGVVIGQYFSFWRFGSEVHVGPAIGPLHPGHFVLDPANVGVLGYAGRVVLGVGMIMVWRAIAKRVLLTFLPPLFRALEPIGMLSPRSGFSSAKQYNKVPKNLPDGVLPSVTQIPEMVRNLRRPRRESVGPQSVADVYEAVAYKDRQRRLSNQAYGDAEQTQDSKDMHKMIVKPRVRYDVEVITKLVVYFGVGWLAIDLVPRACLAVFGP